MTIGRAEIACLIPHQGSMCLLDTVVAWDPDRIVCHSDRHLAQDNPLRASGRLSVLHAVEFAAQAIAAHRRLTASPARAPRYGLLVSLRDCSFAGHRLDTCASPLVIEAMRIAATAEMMTYKFDVRTADEAIAAGRASIVLVEERDA